MSKETDLWLSVRDYLNELSDVACRFGRKEIDGNEFQGKIKGLLKDNRLEVISELDAGYLILEAGCLIKQEAGNKNQSSRILHLESAFCIVYSSILQCGWRQRPRVFVRVRFRCFNNYNQTL